MVQHSVQTTHKDIVRNPSSTADTIVFGFMRHWLAVILAALLIFVLLPFAAPVAMYVGWDGLGNLLYKLYAPTCHQLPQRSWFLFGDRLTYTLDEISQVYPYTDAVQLRSFYGTSDMGWKVAWSDRMISFYMMAPIFGLMYALWRKFRGPLPPISFRLLILLLTPILLDGFTHMANDLLYGVSGGGFRDTNTWLALLTGNRFPGFYAGDHFGTFNWWTRLVSGLLAAWAVAFSVFPWLDRLFQGELERNKRQRLDVREMSELQTTQ